MRSFIAELREQRWDDHRYYHHSRINQTLHFVSAMSFVATYVLLFTHTTVAVLFGWTFAMCIRQVGHFFFEPKGYDEANQATHQYKEEVKVGYNLRRKQVLLSIWALSPLVLLATPSLFGLITPHRGLGGFLAHTATLWLVLGIGAVLFRTVHLFFLKDVQTGLVWLTKIVTDPFHDIALYWRAPLQVLRGELLDPIVEPAA